MKMWTNLILMILLYSSYYQISRSQTCNCGLSDKSTSDNFTLVENECPKPPAVVYLISPTTNATGIFTKSFKICCCINGTSHDNYPITWTLNETLLDKSQWQIMKGNTWIYKSYLDVGDVGEYSCRFKRLESSSQLIQSVHLNMIRSDPHCGIPLNAQILPNRPILELPGKKDVKWHCSASLPGNWLKAKHSLQFFKRPHNESLRSNNKITVNITSSDGKIEGQLKIPKVEKYDFGDYFCLITNYHHQVMLNFSLINGVPEQDRKIGHLRALLTVFFAITALVIIFLSYWLRCRISTILMCKENIRERHCSTGNVAYDDFQFDLFIVHGDDSERWVMLQLLPIIEKGAKYLCFVPTRDILGGQSIPEKLSRAMHKSRRVLIIFSPLLFECEKAVLASYSAVSESLLSGGRGKIFVIILENIKEPTKHTRLLKLLTEYPSVEAPPLVKSVKLTSTEIQMIVRKIFLSVFLIRNPHMNVLEHESMFEVIGEVCNGEEQLYEVMNRASRKVKTVSKTMVRLFWFHIQSVITKDSTHQFWSSIFRALPPSPIQLSIKNSLLTSFSSCPNQSDRDSV